MKVSVRNGSGEIQLDIPKRNLAGVYAPKKAHSRTSTATELERAMNSPHGPRLEDLVIGKSVCVLVEDHTRDEPHMELLSAVVPRLRRANRVQFMIATGSHEVNHPANLKIVDLVKKAATDAGIERYAVKINDCHEPGFVDLGRTKRGTPVLVNSKAVGHDVYVALADMKAHYFAGYSSALKDFLPGVCSFQTIEANHAMALNPKSTFGRHPYHPDPAKRDSPLADDMRDAMEIITKNAKVFTLSVISDENKLVWTEAGSLQPVISRGIAVLDETDSFNVKPTPRIIVSPGGYPQDKSLYHAQRAIELTKNAVADGGEILFIAECRDGVAPEEAVENFYNKLKAPLDEVIRSISGQYHLYEHKAYKFAELLERISAVKMYTLLDRKTVEDVHLQKVENPQAVIDAWIDEDPKTKILVFDKGNKLAIYPLDD
ncbi:MAG: hypothetical protein C4K49_08920 [Candidatus Thorarchaeota archaeon]|nr:MAG: hypothetical protein C4K49_08920 [Candidatus Thorarchaeota archaeon]